MSLFSTWSLEDRSEEGLEVGVDEAGCAVLRLTAASRHRDQLGAREPRQFPAPGERSDGVLVSVDDKG